MRIDFLETTLTAEFSSRAQEKPVLGPGASGVSGKTSPFFLGPPSTYLNIWISPVAGRDIRISPAAGRDIRIPAGRRPGPRISEY